MIFGAHAVIFSKEPQAARELLKTVLGTTTVDAGGGWLIFALPPAEIAVHPTDGAASQQVYLMCEDIEKTITALRAKGVKFTQAVRDVSWGRVCGIALPGGGELGLYQPRHAMALARPGSASKVRAKKKVASKA
jgi:uncharacterized glyoxalase superfamily protein PhnB